MQKLRLLPLAILSLSMGLMTACDSTSSNSSPTITNLYLGDGTATVTLTAGQGSTGIHATVAGQAGFTVAFTVTDSNGNPATSNFTPSFTQPGSSATSWSAFNDGSASLTAKSTAANGTYTLILTASNGGASSVAKTTFKVTGGSVTPVGTATTEYTGSVYDVNGPKQGAYDLISNAGVSAAAAAATKDLKDITAAGTVFDGSLSSGNGATFVKASSSFAYTGATVESITSAFNAGTAVSSIPAPSNGDVWLVKTSRSGTATYIALKFTDVHPETTSSSANDGYVTFTYLK
jgi:hypothetical protein